MGCLSVLTSSHLNKDEYYQTYTFAPQGPGAVTDTDIII